MERSPVFFMRKIGERPVSPRILPLSRSYISHWLWFSIQSKLVLFTIGCRNGSKPENILMLIKNGEAQMERYGRQPLLGLIKFLMSIFVILYGASLTAQELEIKLVNGRNGRPMAGKSSYVNVWVGTERKEAIAIPTDGNGLARLQLTLNTAKIKIAAPSSNRGTIVMASPVLKYSDSLQINVPYALCESGGSNYSWLRSERFSTKEILQHGYVSPNTCGKVRISPQPGQVILFVRPLTLLEKLKQ